MVLSISLSPQANPPLLEKLLGFDRCAMSEHAPPVLEEEPQHDAMPQSPADHLRIGGATGSSLDQPLPKRVSWPDDPPSYVSVPPPEVC